MHLFHWWKKSKEKYNCVIPAHTVEIGDYTIHEEEATNEVWFQIRTCSCGKRQYKTASGCWYDWNYKEGDTIKTKVVGQKEFLL